MTRSIITKTYTRAEVLKMLSGVTEGDWVLGNNHTDNGVYTKSGDLVAGTHSAQRNFRRAEQIAEQNANARLMAASKDIARQLADTMDLLNDHKKLLLATRQRAEEAEGKFANEMADAIAEIKTLERSLIMVIQSVSKEEL